MVSAQEKRQAWGQKQTSAHYRVSPLGSTSRRACSRLEFLREGDTLLVTKIDRLARSTSDLYRIVSELTEKGVSFKVLDDLSIDTTSRTRKLVMGILALIAEFENDIPRERQMDGIAKAKDRGVKFGRKRELTDERVSEIRKLRETGETVPAISSGPGSARRAYIEPWAKPSASVKIHNYAPRLDFRTRISFASLIPCGEICRPPWSG